MNGTWGEARTHSADAAGHAADAAVHAADAAEAYERAVEWTARDLVSPVLTTVMINRTAAQRAAMASWRAGEAARERTMEEDHAAAERAMSDLKAAERAMSDPTTARGDLGVLIARAAVSAVATHDTAAVSAVSELGREASVAASTWMAIVWGEAKKAELSAKAELEAAKIKPAAEAWAAAAEAWAAAAEAWAAAGVG